MDPRSKLLPKNRAQTEASARRKKHNKCPWGCREDNGKCDENGYCRHLVGWSIDGKSIDVRIMVVHKTENATASPIEGLKADGDKVQPKDRVVNMGQDWVRVYRYPGHWPLGAVGLTDEPPVAPDVLSQDQADTAAQDAKIAALEEQIARLTALVTADRKAPSPLPLGPTYADADLPEPDHTGEADADEFAAAPPPAKKAPAKKKPKQSKKAAAKAPPAPTAQPDPIVPTPAQAG